jgi:hypothetical protein
MIAYGHVQIVADQKMARVIFRKRVDRMVSNFQIAEKTV